MKVDELLKLSKEDLKGKLICFPTDTVYGVGFLFNDEIACQKLYEIKKRDFKKPLANLASSVDDIIPYIDECSDSVMKMIKKYWPGALTIIFNKNQNQNILINKDVKTIGFRVPNSQIALKILKKFGIMATTSVNLSGDAPLNDYQEIIKYFGNQIDYIIEDDNEIKSNVSSTVVEVVNNKINILRQGDIIIKN